MEHHHFDQCLMILNSPGNQILSNLSSEDYSRAIKVLEDAILSTDLAVYFRWAVFSRNFLNISRLLKLLKLFYLEKLKNIGIEINFNQKSINSQKTWSFLKRRQTGTVIGPLER